MSGILLRPRRAGELFRWRGPPGHAIGEPFIREQIFLDAITLLYKMESDFAAVVDRHEDGQRIDIDLPCIAWPTVAG